MYIIEWGCSGALSYLLQMVSSARIVVIFVGVVLTGVVVVVVIVVAVIVNGAGVCFVAVATTGGWDNDVLNNVRKYFNG